VGAVQELLQCVSAWTWWGGGQEWERYTNCNSASVRRHAGVLVRSGSGTRIVTVRECVDMVGRWSGVGAVQEL
jgi:hypothetical protein